MPERPPRFLDYTPAQPLAQPNTVLLVAARDSAGQRAFLDGVPGGQHSLYTENNLWGIYAGTVRTGGTPDTARHLVQAVFDGASSLLRIDGVTVLSGGAGGHALGRLRLGVNAAGNGYALVGHICEMLVIHGVLTEEQTAACHAYLTEKWL